LQSYYRISDETDVSWSWTLGSNITGGLIGVTRSCLWKGTITFTSNRILLWLGGRIMVLFSDK